MIYQPAEDSYILARTLTRFARTRSVLDMGAGSGILSEAALNAGASSVCAIDIDLEVIELLKLKRLQAIHSDLFANVSDRFDVIVCNAPYLPEDPKEDRVSKVATTGGKKGDEFILRFLKQAPKHLEKGGIILLMLSSLTPKERIRALLEKQHFTHEIVASQKLFMERLEVWKISFRI